MNKLRILRRLSQYVSLALLLVSAAVLWGWWHKGELPVKEDIVSELAEEPRQFEVTEDEFTFSYRGSDYVIQPVADYSIAGLVVSHNNIHDFDDIYHTGDSVDIRDLCLIWGANVESDVYHKVEFWNEPFSCHVQSKSREDWREFEMAQLSNNHLLARRESVREKINGVRVGDQIRLSGQLINYYPAEHPDWVRASSTIRTDSGNGACEVFMVDDVEVLKEFERTNYSLYETGVKVLLLLMLLKGVLFLAVTYMESYG